MKIRIRFGRGVRISRRKGKNRQAALACAAILIPGAVMCASLAAWRVAADLRLASPFAISEGVFSHWMVWLGLAAVLVGIAIRLNRYGSPPAAG